MKLHLIILSTIILGSCAVGPKFRSPESAIPEGYVNSNDTLDAGDLSHWWLLMGDPMLDTLENQALSGNLNLASAIKNIDIARLNLASAKVTALPSLSLNGSAALDYTYQHKIGQSYSVMPTIAWDIDLWGKIRREIEAAGALFNATAFQTAAVMQALTSQVATTYYAALTYKRALEISENTYLSRLSSEHLMDSMYYYGQISQVDLSQAKASTATAAVAVEQYKRALEQSLLTLNLLTGRNPSPVEIGELNRIEIEIPSGVPSSLLERRPDVIEAYYGVQRTNAMVGVAIANRLPSISLTGDGGLASDIVEDVATAKPVSWSAAASLIAPILNWGTLRRAEKIARIKSEQSLLAYENSVLGAINEVEQALIAVATYKRESAQSEKIVLQSQQAASLTAELYKSGDASYLDVLDADRTLLSSQLQYVQSINSLMTSYITLYKALGGGY